MTINKPNFLKVKQLREQLNRLDSSHDEDIIVLSSVDGLKASPVLGPDEDGKFSFFKNEIYVPKLNDIWVGRTKIRDEDYEEYKNSPGTEQDDLEFMFCDEEERKRAIKCITIATEV